MRCDHFLKKLNTDVWVNRTQLEQNILPGDGTALKVMQVPITHPSNGQTTQETVMVFPDDGRPVEVSFRVEFKNLQPQAHDVKLSTENVAVAEVQRKEAEKAALNNATADQLKNEFGLSQKDLDKKLCRLCGSHNLNLDEIEKYLRAGADPACQDVTGSTPLMVCALNLRRNVCFQKIKLLFKYERGVACAEQNGGSVTDDILGSPLDKDLLETGPVLKGAFQTVHEWCKDRINEEFLLALRELQRAVRNGEDGDAGMELVGYLFDGAAPTTND